jgi:acyl-CoA thioester hydrolase
MLPVIKLDIDYIKPAKYDDLLTITTTLSKKPVVKIEFDFEITNEKQELITTGMARLVFMDMKKNKPIKGPYELLEKIYTHFN